MFRLAAIAPILLAGSFLVVYAQDREDLLQAVGADDVVAVRRLLAQGANPNAANPRGRCALLEAVLKGSADVAAALIEKGAVVDLGSKDDGFTPLMAAAARGDTKIVRLLLAKRATVNARSNTGGTAIMGAAFEGHAAVVSMLAANPGDVNARDATGLTALMLAASQCRFGAIRVLWNAGARIDDRDHAGNTAQGYAAKGKCPSILRAAAADECKDMSTLYSNAELTRWQKRFNEEVERIKKQVESQLQPEGRQRLSQSQVQTPLLDSKCKQPFYYSSFAESRTIVIPTLSVKFLRDLQAANWWLFKQGYELKANQYVAMLKYKRPTDFPGGRYPAPLDALGVPHTPAGEPLYADRGAADEAEALFAGTLFFITAHEAGHVVLQHARSTPENETLADAFAFEMLIRSGGYPGGVGEFLGFASYWAPNGGDFDDGLQYRIWLAAEATHPATASRMRQLGASIHELPQNYLRGVPDSNPTVKAVRDLGLSLVSLADRIDRYTTFPEFFADTLAMNLSHLRPVKRAAGPRTD